MGTAVPEQHPAVHKLNIGHLERANLISGTRTACQGGLAAGLAVTLDVCQLTTGLVYGLGFGLGPWGRSTGFMRTAAAVHKQQRQ